MLASSAAELKEARVSQVIKDVKLLPAQAAPRPAAISDEVRDGTAVRTGIQSRAELTFTDQTLARLGANTIFSFREGTRNLELNGGVILLRVPKNAGGAQIHTSAVTAAITGTTVMLEYHPNAYIKFIVLEGTGRMMRKDHVGESVLVHAGQMLIVNPKATSLPDPVDVDLERLTKTSALLSREFAPIQSMNLIAQQIQAQTALKAQKVLLDTNLVIFGGGTAATLVATTELVDQRVAVAQTTSPEPSATATPTPTATATPHPTATATPTPTATATPTPTATATPTPSATATPTPTATATPTPSATATPTPTATATPTPTATPTITPTPTPTVSPTPTPTITPTPTPTVTPPPAEMATYNGGTGNWSDPTKWTPGVVPNNGNNGVDYDVTFSTGTLTQDIVDGVTINQLFMSGGTLILANPLTLNYGLHFSGGGITNGILNIAGDSTQTAVMTINGTTINNSGHYDITLISGNVFSGGASNFNNTGMLLGNSTDGTVSFNMPLNNSGTVSAESGTFSLTSGGTISGTAAAAAGAVLQFGSNFTFADGSQIAGLGLVQFNNGTTTNLFGTITNNGNVLINSTGSFTDFVLNGNVTFAGSGVITLTDADRIRGSGILTNAGNSIQGETSNSGSLGNNEIGIINQAGGLIDASVPGLFLLVDPNSNDGLTNTGVMQASGGGLLRLTGNGDGRFQQQRRIDPGA